ncbi:MAG: beta-galactosidase [Thermofilaceae archaeon]
MAYLGVDYYPEHWPRERWDLDIRLMREAGINVVRLAEFAWCRLEPQPGKYDFSWLDEVVDKMSKAGLKVILGTPTAAPPPWLVKLYPDVLPVDHQGHRMPPVMRRHYCPNNPNYVRLSVRIVKAIAEHYRDNPTVVGYQVDNEFGFYGDYCYCEHCVRGFREWLESKYGSVDNLNRAYGTIFWSQEYRDWSEIHPPTPPYDGCNRSLALDWFRFRSESFVRYLKRQVDVIKSVSPEKRVTTNLPGAFPADVDSYALSSELDFASLDCYPAFGRLDKEDPAWTALEHDASRVMGRGVYWVMELQAGSTDGYFNHPIGRMPEPGELRRWAYQAIAHGAEGVVYFRWRTACFGKEQYWHGILNHDGEVNRRYLEVKKLGGELSRLREVLAGSRFESRVAVLFSYDSYWSLQIERGYYTRSYTDQVLAVYRALWLRSINVDVVPPDWNLSRYRVVFAPFLYLTDEQLTGRLESFVREGGVLVASARTSVKDSCNNVYPTGLPGRLVDVFGARVIDYTPLPPNAQAHIAIGGEKHPATGWLEELAPTTAKAMGVHDYKWLSGKPAVTVNELGRGRAIYVGSFLTPELAEAIVDLALGKEVAPPVLRRGDFAEVTVKEKDDGSRLVFVINHESEMKKVELLLPEEHAITFLLRGAKLRSDRCTLELGPHDVEVLLLEK